MYTYVLLGLHRRNDWSAYFLIAMRVLLVFRAVLPGLELRFPQLAYECQTGGGPFRTSKDVLQPNTIRPV